jgi:Protein of unknown function (DUF3138)
MTTRPQTVLAQAIALAFATAAGSAWAQSAADMQREIDRLKARVGELERKDADMNRITVKAEALEDARDASGLKLLKISGYMDPTFIYNKRQNRMGFQFLNRVGDDGYYYDNSYFGAAVIDFQKETDSGTKWRLTLAPNRGVGSVSDFGSDSPVHEASISVPLTDLQTRFIAGQIPDWSGYEYLQPTLNKLITHNLLFDLTLPAAYTGAGMEVTSGKWIMKGMVANMNASRRTPGNKTPVLAYRVDYSRGEFQGFGFAGLHGKAANFADVNGVDTSVNLFEVDGYFIRGDWTVQGQLSVGKQKDAAITLGPNGEFRDSSWWGASALAAYKWTPRFETTSRIDYINNKKNGGGLLTYTVPDDRNGIGPDPAGDPEVGANRMALTLGASWLFNLNTTFKLEYRLDRANLPVFIDVKSGEYSKSNQLIGASVLVSF